LERDGEERKEEEELLKLRDEFDGKIYQNEPDDKIDNLGKISD